MSTVLGRIDRTVRRTLWRGERLVALCLALQFLCSMPISIASDEEYSGYRWQPDQFPNILRQAKFCTSQRNPPSAICDPEMVLSKTEAHQLDKIISNIENISNSTRGTTSQCICEPCPPNAPGLAITVAIATAILRPPNQTISESVEHFAERTRSNWNISPVCHHDVVIMLVMEWNKLYIAMGDKAARVIGSNALREMIAEAENHFKFANTFQALETVIRSAQSQANQYDARLDRLGLHQGLMVMIIAALLTLALIILGVWFCIRREAKQAQNACSEDDLDSNNRRKSNGYNGNNNNNGNQINNKCNDQKSNPKNNNIQYELVQETNEV